MSCSATAVAPRSLGEALGNEPPKADLAPLHAAYGHGLVSHNLHLPKIAPARFPASLWQPEPAMPGVA